MIDEVLDDDDSLTRFVALSTSLDGRQRGLDIGGLRRRDAMTGQHLRMTASADGLQIAVAEVSGAYNDPTSVILPAHVVVHEDHRKQGIGSALFARLSGLL